MKQNQYPGILPFAASVEWYKLNSEAEELRCIDFDCKLGLFACNRFRIDAPEGFREISVPLLSEGKKGRYSDLKVDYREKWNKKLINALKTGYGNSPFYQYYDYEIENILNIEYETFKDLNVAVRNWTLMVLKWNQQIEWVDNEEVIAQTTEVKPYYQVFQDKYGFRPGMSILDLIFCEGTDAGILLLNSKES